MVNINSGLSNISNPYTGTQNRKIQSDITDGKVFKVHRATVYMKTDDMLFSGGNGTGLSFYLVYAKESTKDNPVVIAKGIDENGKEFEQKIAVNNINPSNASYVEMRALEAHYKVDTLYGFSSLPFGDGDMGLNDRRNFISMFEKVIQDMQKLARYDLVSLYRKNLLAYENIAGKFWK